MSKRNFADLLLAECEACGQVHYHPHIPELGHAVSALSKAVAKLTPAEYKVFIHMASGAANRQLAVQLYLTEFTIKADVTSIRRKLGGPTRVQIALASNIWNAWCCTKEQSTKG